MTWGQYIDSKYNTLGFRKNTSINTTKTYISLPESYSPSFDLIIAEKRSFEFQTTENVILAGKEYRVYHKDQ